MKYIAKFCNDWAGTWKFDAVNDVRAWEIVWNMIKEHTLVAIVNIEVIYEIDDSGDKVRKLPAYEDCIRTDEKRESKKNEKLEEKAIYKAYFTDGECSGPYVSTISTNDIIALDMAKCKLKQHVEYNGLDVAKVRISKVEEINENELFSINLTRKEKKKNRMVQQNG